MGSEDDPIRGPRPPSKITPAQEVMAWTPTSSLVIPVHQWAHMPEDEVHHWIRWGGDFAGAFGALYRALSQDERDNLIRFVRDALEKLSDGEVTFERYLELREEWAQERTDGVNPFDGWREGWYS